MRRLFKIFIYGVFFTSFSAINAQEIGEYKLSLQKALEIMQQQAPTIHAKKAEMMQSEEIWKTSKRELAPQIDFSSDIRHNFSIPKTPVPAFLFNPNADKDEIAIMKFATPYSSSAGVNLSFELFNPNKWGELNKNKAKKEIAQAQFEWDERQAKIKVIDAYAKSLLTNIQEQTLAQDTLVQHLNLQRSILNYEKGKISKEALNEAKENQITALKSWREAQAIFLEALDELWYEIGYNPEDITYKTILSDDIETLLKILEENYLNIENYKSENNLPTQLKALQLQLAKTERKSVLLGFFPTLSLKGFAGYNYYGKTLAWSNTDRWHSSSYLSLSLQIPISESFSRSSKLKGKNFALQTAKQELKNKQNEQGKLHLKLYRELQNNYKEVKDAEELLKMAQERVKIREYDLEKGRALPSEYQQMKQKELAAHQNLLASKYNLIKTILDIYLNFKN